MVEVILEHSDFEYFDYKNVESFVMHQKAKGAYQNKTQSKDKNLVLNYEDRQDIDLENEYHEEPKLTNVFMEAFKMTKEKLAGINQYNSEPNNGLNSDRNSMSSSKKDLMNAKQILNSAEESLESMLPTAKPDHKLNKSSSKASKVQPIFSLNDSKLKAKGFSSNTSRRNSESEDWPEPKEEAVTKIMSPHIRRQTQVEPKDKFKTNIISQCVKINTKK